MSTETKVMRPSRRDTRFVFLKLFLKLSWIKFSKMWDKVSTFQLIFSKSVHQLNISPFSGFKESSMEGGFQPSSFQKILQLFSQGSGGNNPNTILTSVSSPGRSAGSLGTSLPSPDSSSTFSKRILSVPPQQSQTDDLDDPFSFQPLVNELHVDRTKNIIDEKSSPLSFVTPQKHDQTVHQLHNNVIETIEDDVESLPIATVIPAIISAMNDEATTLQQKSSLVSLLSDMVETVQIAEQRQQQQLQSSRQTQVNNNNNNNNNNLPRVSGGVDFSQATRTADGRLCVIKEDTVETLAKEPVLECVHKNIEKCHYTYVTKFSPTQQEECQENFEKNCQITFRQEAVRNTVRKCYRPQVKVCNGQGPEQCRTVFETDCTTKVS